MSELGLIKPFIELLAGEYGKLGQLLATVAMFIGTIRLFVKPIMVAIETIIKDTDTQKDDEALAKIKSNPVIKTIAFVMDYVLSIKLPTASKLISK